MLSRSECSHNINNSCQVASLISGKKCIVRTETCEACSTSPRPQRLNIHTAMLAVMHNPHLDTSLLNAVIEGNHQGLGTALAEQIEKIPSVFGKKLAIYLEPLFQEYPGCGCPGLKDVLDVWTPEYVKDNIDSVVSILNQQARSRNLPFFRPLARYFIRKLLEE